MTDVSSIPRITMVRNRLVYVLIAIAISLTTMSLLSYFYVFSFLLWLFVIALFFGILGVILKLSNQIFDINNPDYVEPIDVEPVPIAPVVEEKEVLAEVIVETPKPQKKSKDSSMDVLTAITLLPLGASLLLWIIIFLVWGFFKLTGLNFYDYF